MSKTVPIRVRMTPSQRMLLSKRAQMVGVNLSEYVRGMLTGAPILTQIDREMIGELRRQGGLLKLIHLESGGAYSDMTAKILHEIHSLIVKLKEGSLGKKENDIWESRGQRLNQEV